MSACPLAREQHLARLRRIAGPPPRTARVKFGIDAAKFSRQLIAIADVLQRAEMERARRDEQVQAAVIRWGRRWGIVPTPLEQLRRHIESVRAGR